MKIEEFIIGVLNQTITNPRDPIVCGIRYCREFLHNEHVKDFSLTQVGQEGDSEYWARHKLLVALDNELKSLIEEGDL